MSTRRQGTAGAGFLLSCYEKGRTRGQALQRTGGCRVSRVLSSWAPSGPRRAAKGLHVGLSGVRTPRLPRHRLRAAAPLRKRDAAASSQGPSADECPAHRRLRATVLFGPLGLAQGCRGSGLQCVPGGPVCPPGAGLRRVPAGRLRERAGFVRLVVWAASQMIKGMPPRPRAPCFSAGCPHLR